MRPHRKRTYTVPGWQVELGAGALAHPAFGTAVYRRPN